MNMKSVSVPEIYKESQDFRFFIDWFSTALRKIQYDTENLLDLYDPLKCPEDLLWALADTMGYKYDDRLPTSFNRLVLLYFMSLIYNRGSKDGVALAAEVNLAQLKILMQANGYKTRDDDGNVTYVKGNPILNNRLEDTTIPVNAVSVIPHTEQGYIDVVYYASVIPIDACIEYVRPLGMFCFQHAGVCFESRTKIKIDARLTNTRDLGMSFGPTHVGHYRREDYARLQKTIGEGSTFQDMTNDETHLRHEVWYRNSTYEDNNENNHDGTYGSGTWSRDDINPGYRSLYSLQLSNNEETIKALISPIFSLGYEPQSIDVEFDDDYLTNPSENDKKKPWNLRYDKTTDEEYTLYTLDSDGNKIFHVTTVDSERSADILNPRPAVNPVMTFVGDAMSMNSGNTLYTKTDEDMKIEDTSRNVDVVNPITGEKYGDETDSDTDSSAEGDTTE